MTNYKRALSIFLAIHSANAFQPILPSQRQTTRRAASISTLFNEEPSNSNKSPMASIGESVRTVKVAYIDAVDAEKDEFEQQQLETKANRKKRVVLALADDINEQLTFEYGVEIPIVTTKSVGISLREVDSQGELNEIALELDSLRYVSVEEEQMQKSKGTIMTIGEEGDEGTVQILDEDKFQLLDKSSLMNSSSGTGIVVSSVVRGGIAWELGVRAGDFLVATSATIGDKMWPKSTVEGVRSAISSRKVMSKTMKFNFQRVNEIAGECESELVQEFELSLSRPMGIHIEDTKDGYVRISGFTEDVPEYVSSNLKVGDRITAVDSSLGNQLWPVSNVEGVVSAVTTRLPGQQVRIRFERIVEEGADLSEISSIQDTKEVKNAKKSLTNGLLSSYSRFAKEVNAEEVDGLLSRCCSVLNRYITVHDENSVRSADVLAIVAERVLESLADVSAKLDAKTLSLVMNAFITCDQPERALEAFEAAVGLKADGSAGKPQSKIIGKKAKNRVTSSLNGLNLYTATDVIRAHAALGNSPNARRVLAAMEGSYATIDGVQSHYWGDDLKPDTKCFNTVLAAIANAEEIIIAEEMFENMASSSLKKNLVTYNTMISAYARCGRREDAFAMFKTMKKAGLKPDKVTVTSLIKAVINDGDFDTARNLLKDMKKAKIKADVVTYNTVIRALCESSRWFEAKELVAEMEANGVNPDSKTYGLLMNGLLKLKKPGPCLTLFESACADQRTAALMENVQLYTTAITAAASLGDSERAFELISRMNFAGVKPNMKTLTALMSACVSDNKFTYALDVYKKMSTPDGHANTLALKAYCGLLDYSSAFDLLVEKEAQFTGKQSIISYNYIIGSALNQKDFKTAIEAMTTLLQKGFIPSKKTYDIIFNTLGLFQKTSATKGSTAEKDNSTFKFLLKVLDLLESRKLKLTGHLYAGILAEAGRLGGMEKKIAAYIVEAKSDDTIRSVHVDNSETFGSQRLQSTWSDLLQNYAEMKHLLDNVDLPLVRVQINEREIRQVLFAERGVTYNKRRTKGKNCRQSSRQKTLRWKYLLQILNDSIKIDGNFTIFGEFSLMDQMQM